MFGIILLLEGPVTSKFQLLRRWHDVLSIFPATHCRFPVPDETNQLQSVTEPCPCLTAGRCSFQWIPLPLDILLIHWLCFITQQKRIPNFLRLNSTVLSILELTFLCFWVSSGEQAWGPLAFSLSLTVQTETSVSAAIKPCCMSFIVTQRFLICLLRNTVTAIESFFFLPLLGSIATVVLNLNLQNVDCCCYFYILFVVFCKTIISSLNFMDYWLKASSNM